MEPLKRVTRRHVIYVPGYDPHGLRRYYRLFRTELRKFTGVYNIQTTLSKAESSERRHETIWTVKAAGDGWNVESTYHFLRWEDLILADFARPAWWKIFHFLKVIASWLVDGTLMRVARASWRCCCFMLYTPITLVLIASIAALLGWATCWLATAMLPIPFLPTTIGVVVAAFAFIAIVRVAEPQLMLLYLAGSYLSAHDFVNRRRPDWEERLQLLATYLADTAAKNDADEIVIVGHSAGTFLAIDVLARALEQDPKLGQHGPRIALLTVGANVPIVGFQRNAQWFRDRLRLLNGESTIDWVDYQSRKDVMNFYPFDPIAGHGIPIADRRINLRVVRISFRDMISAEMYRQFRWRFFRIHFQYIMANDLPSHYDYFLVVCGPYGLRYRAENYFEMRDSAAAMARPHVALPPLRLKSR